jgi:cysteine desulfuration protein SufE
MNTLDELAETFELLGDWEERYRHLIDLGRKLEPMPEPDKTEATKVRGCMSQVWMTARTDGERLHFRGDSDAHLVRGLIALLFLLVQDRTRAEILDTDIQAAFTRLGFENHITMNRRNGFYAMVERIRQMAAGNAPLG